MPIIIRQAKDPFWTVRAPEGMTLNPLGYHCAPNAADCRYAGAQTIEDFIAYGFMESWLSPGDFDSWERLEKEDIQWLREYFLRQLEDTLQYLYNGDIELEPGKPYDQFDYGHDNSLHIGNSDENPDDEELDLRWVPHSIGTDGCIIFDFDCVVLNDGSNGGDPVSIFLSKEAYANKARVRAAIAMARRVNGLCLADDSDGLKIMGEDKLTAGLWERLGVPSVQLPFDVRDCKSFGDWVSRIALGFDAPAFVPGNVIEE